MKYKVSNAYYFRHINSIGGIESHLYYLSKKYCKDTNITIFYHTGDSYQINRISKYAEIIPLVDKDTIECENLFCCFNTEVLNVAKAKNTYLVLHGDYKDMVERNQLRKDLLPIDHRINKYLGVSQLVCDSWKEITGIDAELVGEPVILEKVKKPLLFCSATRLTKEKGWWRMQQLAKTLNDHKVNYLWFIFTNKTPENPMENMIIMPHRLDITDKLELFDAVIQLSDNEGFNITAIESLLRGVPLIATDLKVYKELGINENNSVLLDLEMNDIPVERIENIYKLNVKYKAPNDYWNKYLKMEKPKKRKKNVITVKATENWVRKHKKDIERNVVPKKGDIWQISYERYGYLLEYERKTGVKFIERVEDEVY